MKIAISFLSSRYDFTKTIELINKTSADYIHVDVMDGLFVNNTTPFNKNMLDILKSSKKKKDIHLMTLHVKQFVDVFSYLKPEYITYQFEALTNHNEMINYIKEKGCKVGISINPLTNIEDLDPYLNKIDLVLVMSVIPGYGGQKFLKETPERIKELKKRKKEQNAKFKISVDGGMNEETIQCLKKSKPNMIVTGSYVCKSTNFEEKIESLRMLKK